MITVLRDVDGVPDWSVKVKLSLVNEDEVVVMPYLRPIAFPRGFGVWEHDAIVRAISRRRITGRGLDLI